MTQLLNSRSVRKVSTERYVEMSLEKVKQEVFYHIAGQGTTERLMRKLRSAQGWGCSEMEGRGTGKRNPG